MGTLLNMSDIDSIDATAIRNAMVDASDGIWQEDENGIYDYFANIPVGKPVSEVPLSNLFAESYIDRPRVCQYGGHVVVKHGANVKRYGAGEIRDKILPLDTIIVAVQPYLPRVSGITERGSLEKGPFGRLSIGHDGYSISTNMSLFVDGTGKYRGWFTPEMPTV